MNMNKIVKSLRNTIMTAALTIFAVSSFGTPTKALVNVPGNDEGNIIGYTAGGTVTYSVDVFWLEDLTFIFDNGRYNKSSGELESSLTATSENESEITQNMVEKNATAGAIKKWYGFDGIRNRVIVLNRSNADITAQYTTTTNSESFVGDNVTALELYDYAPNNDVNGYSLTIAQEDILEDPADPESVLTDAGYPSDLNDEVDLINRFGNNEKLTEANNTKTLKAAPGNGTMYANKVFLNITGTPVNAFSRDYTNPGSLGTITITFNKV